MPVNHKYSHYAMQNHITAVGSKFWDIKTDIRVIHVLVWWHQM